MGQSSYVAHKELNVPICESQAEWTPLQRIFLEHAAKHRQDESDAPDPDGSAAAVGNGSSARGTDIPSDINTNNISPPSPSKFK